MNMTFLKSDSYDPRSLIFFPSFYFSVYDMSEFTFMTPSVSVRSVKIRKQTLESQTLETDIGKSSIKSNASFFGDIFSME